MRKPQRPAGKTPQPEVAEPAADTAGERLQKVLAQAGLGSRREIETWIAEGRIQINGRRAKLGDRCKVSDRVLLNGKPLDLRGRTETTRVLLYHKPVGELVSRRDPEGRPVVFTQLPKPVRGRWIAVGRLDINTQGLLLLTTNGELANRMMHPSRQVEREYAVRVLGPVDEARLERLQQGVVLEDGPARFERIEAAGGEGANRWFHVTLTEGRNRIVRRLWESQNITVSRLIRIRFGEISLPPGLKARAAHELTPDEVAVLMQAAGLAPDPVPSSRSGNSLPKRPGSLRNRRR